MNLKKTNRSSTSSTSPKATKPFELPPVTRIRINALDPKAFEDFCLSKIASIPDYRDITKTSRTQKRLDAIQQFENEFRQNWLQSAPKTKPGPERARACLALMAGSAAAGRARAEESMTPIRDALAACPPLLDLAPRFVAAFVTIEGSIATIRI